MSEQGLMNKLTELRQDFLSALQAASEIGITTHINPDGDGFCAALAMQYFLLHLEKGSVIYIDPSTDLERYRHLMNGAKVQDYEAAPDRLDLLIVLDCNSYDRLGERSALVHCAKQCFLLDHHLLEHNPIKADFSYIDPSYASVGAMLFEMLQDDISDMPEAERIPIANCIYTTILNDTNNFANANTDALTFRISAALQDLGIKAHKLYQQFFLNHTPEEMRYVGQTLATIGLHFDRRILLMHSSLAMSKENSLDPESLMSVTRWVQGVAGITAIVYLREDAPETFKVSLRSPLLDVNRIAIKYGGGGHRSASGCTIHGTLEAVSAMLLADFEAAL